MHTTTRACRTVTVYTAAAALLATAGCQTGDRAGGNIGVEPTVLSFALTGVPPSQVTEWVAAVDQLSKGTLKIDVKQDTALVTSPEFESGLIADVRAGTFDLAWVGARVFDRVGVTSFQALLAPMLVDSLDLQAKVFDAGIPAEMLTGLQRLGLVGVGIWPGPLRKVLGIAKPFTAPGDFAGAVVGIQDSALAEQTFRTLGAEPKNVPAGASLDGLDAYDQQLASIAGNHYAQQAKYVTGNLNMWPRPLVVIANANAYGRLTDDQRAMLAAAAKDGMQRAVEDERAADRDAIPVLCRDGLTFTESTPAEFAAFAKTLAPVYDQIMTDSAGKAWLDRIQAIKQTLHRAPDGGDCANVAGAVQASPYDGTYRRFVRWSKIDIRGCPEFRPEEATGVNELVLDKGVYRLWNLQRDNVHMHELGDQGQYRFFGNQMQFGDLSNPYTVDFTYDGKKLTLSNMRGGSCGDAIVYTSTPWIRQ